MEQPPENPTPGEPMPSEAGKGLVDFFKQKITTLQHILNGMDSAVQRQALKNLVDYQTELSSAMVHMDKATWDKHRDLLLGFEKIVAKLVTDTQREYTEFQEVDETHGPKLRAYYQSLINQAQANIETIKRSLES